MELAGQKFTNSAACSGEGFASAGAPLDLAEITISGRYPEKGWARNLESHEMVRVLRGVGSLAFRDGEVTKLTEGDVVHVPPKVWFAWNGNVTILMACSPAFNSNQYEIEREEL